jgi:hypothetical protein
VQALGHDKGNGSTSLRNLEAKGLVRLTKTLGGRIEAVDHRGAESGRRAGGKL